MHAAVLCHMLLIGGRSPNKILYSHSSGRVWQTDLVPLYDGAGTLERNEPVPFRLTRNMVAFFSHFGVDGVFVTSMVAAAQACAPPAEVLRLLECNGSCKSLDRQERPAPARQSALCSARALRHGKL